MPTFDELMTFTGHPEQDIEDALMYSEFRGLSPDVIYRAIHTSIIKEGPLSGPDINRLIEFLAQDHHPIVCSLIENEKVHATFLEDDTVGLDSN